MPKPKKRKPVPLLSQNVSQPMKSRKRARHVTTQFHKLTRERDLALQEGNTDHAKICEQKLEAMGGRPEYQRASQLSTSHHSTSKWVLGHLESKGWLHGIKIENDNTINCGDGGDSKLTGKRKREKIPRRTTRILEVGAINTELLDAAAAATSTESGLASQDGQSNKKYNIHVRAIDLHSMEERIEEKDFLDLPYIHSDVTKRYDAIVCSMVLNCVTTPIDRGRMLCQLFHHVRPGGLCFLTIPKFCLSKSAFLTPSLFQELLQDSGVGFSIQFTKVSPKISFFVLLRPTENRTRPLDPIWTKQVVRNKGKKYPNQFCVVLNEAFVFPEQDYTKDDDK
jgi:25S rRNA (adenine2142-N1)-methyltransferase